MDATNFEEVYGYYLLVSEGLVVYNPKYVVRYGRFMYCLERLKHKPKKDTTDYLQKTYLNSAESAKFYATCPLNLNGKTKKELLAIRKLRQGG